MPPKLLTLEATRHLIVHRAGLIDEEYLRRTSAQMPVGHPLDINGVVVSELANTAILAGCKVIRAVDEWITKAT